MLHLAAPTRESWVPEALGALDEVLLDHAHCEKKAASTAMNLMFRYADRPALMQPLSELAREELRHFEEVLAHLAAQGLPFRRLEPSPYAARLHKAVRRQEPQRLLDTLLCCALIEARSCERLKLLSENLEDPDLAAFYAGLLASEARHFSVYTDLCRRFFAAEEVATRLAELAAHEAEVLTLGSPAVRLHS